MNPQELVAAAAELSNSKLPSKEQDPSAKPAAPPAKGSWSDIEVSAFIRGLLMHGEGKWVAIAKVVETRTSTQCKSKAQKVKDTQPQVWDKLMHRFKENEMKAGHGYVLEDHNDTLVSSLIELVKAPGKQSKNKRRPPFNPKVQADSSREEHIKGNPAKINGNSADVKEKQRGVADNLLMLANVARDDTSTESTQDNVSVIAVNEANASQVKRDTAANDTKDDMPSLHVNTSAFPTKAQLSKGQSKEEDISTDGSPIDNPLESSKIETGKVQGNADTSRTRRKRTSSPSFSESTEKKKQKKQPQSAPATAQGPWTDEEKVALRKGILFLGIGKWSTISREYLTTRNGVQIKSHAQKLKNYHTREWEALLWIYENETLEFKMKWLDNYEKTKGFKEDDDYITDLPSLPQHKNGVRNDALSNDPEHVPQSTTKTSSANSSDSTACPNVPDIQNISLATLRRLVSRLSPAELAYVAPSRDRELIELRRDNNKLLEENASLTCDIEKLQLKLAMKRVL
jgi:hypothetical protein